MSMAKDWMAVATAWDLEMQERAMNRLRPHTPAGQERNRHRGQLSYSKTQLSFVGEGGTASSVLVTQLPTQSRWSEGQGLRYRDVGSWGSNKGCISTTPVMTMKPQNTRTRTELAYPTCSQQWQQVMLAVGGVT